MQARGGRTTTETLSPRRALGAGRANVWTPPGVPLFIGPLDRSPIGVVFIACALRGRVPIAALCISIFFRVRRATGNCPNDLLLGLVRFVHHFRALVRTRRPVQARVLPWTLLLRASWKISRCADDRLRGPDYSEPDYSEVANINGDAYKVRA
jgi:hypothetical protein